MKRVWIPASLALFFGLWGIRWGLPSEARANFFMRPELRNEAFYKKVETARDKLYERLGHNPMAHVGKMAREGKTYQSPTDVLSVYSSFLTRTHDGDEQATLVMISRIDPRKGKWDPRTYAYGGAYIYPLTGFLGTAYGLGWVRLVPQASYYYARPAEIARAYLVVRLWTLVGFVLAVLALFILARTLYGDEEALWASCFLALAPAMLGFAHIGKPHVWSAMWTLLSVGLCAKFKQDPTRERVLWAAAACFGLGTGTTLSQWIFAPFFIWASWTGSPMANLRRLFLAAGIGALIFTVTNPSVFISFKDFLDEAYFFSRYSPFRVNLSALWQYLGKILRSSLGMEMWILSLSGVALCLWRPEGRHQRAVFALALAALAMAAFQTQAMAGDPLLIRPFLALVGFFSLAAAAATFRLPWGKSLRWGVLCALLVRAVVYDLHIASDRAPRDNASLAAAWIHENIPAGSELGHGDTVPLVYSFPPIDFSLYNTIFSGKDHWPEYYIVHGKDASKRAALLQKNYFLLQRFAESPLQRWGRQDTFTNANYSLEIYRRKE
jgi:hypothetical protein